MCKHSIFFFLLSLIFFVEKEDISAKTNILMPLIKLKYFEIFDFVIICFSRTNEPNSI